MSDDRPLPPITHLLLAWTEGKDDVLPELVMVVSDELRRMARQYLQRERVNPLLQPSDLVQDFFIKVYGSKTVELRNRKHFFGFAGQAMRKILIDYARRRDRQKNASGQKPISLDEGHHDEVTSAPKMEPAELLDLHAALEKLAKKDPDAAQVVEQRFFLGLTIEETAAALETNRTRVKRDWEFAQLWLAKELRK